MSARVSKSLLIAAPILLVALLAWVTRDPPHSNGERMRAWLSRTVARLPAIKPRPMTISDPLQPSRPARLLGKRDTSFRGVSAKLGSVTSSLMPEERDRVHKSPKARGGIDPCNSPDPGFGIYDKWRWGGGAGKLLVPLERVRNRAAVDVVFHFAGYELMRKEAARADTPFVILGVAFPGGGLNYRRNLSGPHGLLALEKAVAASLERVPDVPKKLRHRAVSAWSAGYDGVGVLLQQSENAGDIDAVILLDGLHASRKDEVAELQLEPFIRFAQRAAAGGAFMFVSYSSVPTDGYASTHETGRRLIRSLGGEPLFVEREDAGGLELKEMFSKGNFHARGYRGGDELDHCAHLMLYPMALEALERHWNDNPN